MTSNRGLFYCALTLGTVGFAGCGSPVVRIDSTPPGASVRVVDPTTGQLARVGETPIEVTRTGSEALDADMILIELVKEGYETERFFVPNTMRFRRMSYADLKVSMKEKLPVESTARMKDTWNRAINILMEAQRLTIQRKYEMAESKLLQATELVGEFPEAKRLFGTIYYLQGRFARSKKLWSELLEINPNDAEAFRMFKLIEAKGPVGDDG